MLVLALLIFGLLSRAGLAQGVRVDSGLLRDIIRGHQLLAQNTECLSGKIELVRGTSKTEKLEYSSSRNFLFFQDKDSLRLEYIAPREGTEIFPGHEKNDIVEVFMKTKDRNFKYAAIGTTGVPYANLSRSTVISEGQKITLDADFYSNINALFAPSSFSGAKVIDVLQDEIGFIENRKYNDVADALWIGSPKRVDSAGNASSWKIVLHPSQHYALLFYEMRMENSKTGRTLVTTGTVLSQVTDDGIILPKEIVVEGKTRWLSDGQNQMLTTGERALMTVFSTDKPDGKLFTEKSFEDMGRDYTVVDILPNQKMAPGGHVVSAAPLAARTPYYPIEGFARADWPWWRIVLVSIGIVIIAIACFRMYLRWRRFQNQ